MLPCFRRSRFICYFPLLLFFSYTAGASPPAELTYRSTSLALSAEVAAGMDTGDTLHIIAVMAEFQPEDNRFTSGDGTFDLDYLQRDDIDIVIDPLPHNRTHFEAHLEFAKNYFESVSGNRLNISYHIHPDMVRLDRPMRDYAPIGETGEENFKLAHLARDVWNRVGPVSPPPDQNPDPDRTMFIIFHAGAGRNIELMGTSLYKTPQDIPSVYLGTDALGRLLDDPEFDGFDIGDPVLRVTNTALIPQTQSRAGEDITGTEYVLQLSINGILVANIGSFLGLPDLFDTRTGASAIGRFGLMDGASIFSYRGLFPPEPSAWEKIHLGWAEPFDITLDTSQPIMLPAASMQQDLSIARHRISDDEYFLIENRHRNPDLEPLELTIRTPDGRTVTRFIEPDDARFDPFDISRYDEILEPGVITNVSNFDWSLPGGPDFDEEDARGDHDDRILNGGILIWHIDEAVIRRTISQNRVNADRDRRGVQLVEADGSRDIGRPPLPGQDRFVNGHAFDFWWSGNDFTVITATGDSIVAYENRFGPDTRPSNHSNAGSPSFFEFFDFSDNLDIAWFYARSLPGIWTRPVDSPQPAWLTRPVFPPETTAFPVSPELISNPDGNQLLLPSPDGFFIAPFPANDEPHTFLEHPWPSSPLIRENRIISGQTGHGTTPQEIRSWIHENDQWLPAWSHPLRNIPSGPGLVSSMGVNEIHADLTPARFTEEGSLLDDFSGAYQQSAETNGLFSFLLDDRFEISDGSFFYDLDQQDRVSLRKYTGNIRFSGDDDPAFFLLTDHRLCLIKKNSSREWQLDVVYEGNNLSWPALGDWTGDNSLDLFFTDDDGKRLLGLNRYGALLDHFPLQARYENRYIGSPLLADLTGDGHLELIIAASDTLNISIRAYNRFAELIEDFPLLAGSVDPGGHQPPPLLIAGEYLISVAPGGEVKAWNLPERGTIAWGRVYGPQPGNKAGKNARQTARPPEDFGLLNKQETYNWPNPATDHTHIRFMTSEPARIDITVMHPAGRTVFEHTTETPGQYPQEVRLNTSSWGNGIYFARIRAGNGSKSESSLIKIVVNR